MVFIECKEEIFCGFARVIWIWKQMFRHEILGKKSIANKWFINYSEGKTKRCYLSLRAKFSENCFLLPLPLLHAIAHRTAYDERGMVHVLGTYLQISWHFLNRHRKLQCLTKFPLASSSSSTTTTTTTRHDWATISKIVTAKAYVPGSGLHLHPNKYSQVCCWAPNSG